MAKRLTVRGLSDEVSRRLEELSKAKGKSVKATVLEVLEHALDVDERRRRLARHANWSPAQREEFEGALGAQRVIDVGLRT